jgi:hypothetical protein
MRANARAHFDAHLVEQRNLSILMHTYQDVLRTEPAQTRGAAVA